MMTSKRRTSNNSTYTHPRLRTACVTTAYTEDRWGKKELLRVETGNKNNTTATQHCCSIDVDSRLPVQKYTAETTKNRKTKQLRQLLYTSSAYVFLTRSTVIYALLPVLRRSSAHSSCVCSNSTPFIFCFVLYFLLSCSPSLWIFVFLFLFPCSLFCVFIQ